MKYKYNPKHEFGIFRPMIVNRPNNSNISWENHLGISYVQNFKCCDKNTLADVSLWAPIILFLNHLQIFRLSAINTWLCQLISNIQTLFTLAVKLATILELVWRGYRWKLLPIFFMGVLTCHAREGAYSDGLLDKVFGASTLFLRKLPIAAVEVVGETTVPLLGFVEAPVLEGHGLDRLSTEVEENAHRQPEISRQNSAK